MVTPSRKEEALTTSAAPSKSKLPAEAHDLGHMLSSEAGILNTLRELSIGHNAHAPAYNYEGTDQEHVQLSQDDGGGADEEDARLAASHEYILLAHPS